jgi:uncharacterized protein (UPF0332 family)
LKINIDKEYIEGKYNELVSINSIKTDDIKVYGLIPLMVKKANNNLKYAKLTYKISSEAKTKESLELSKDDSFYDWVIISSYYSMFHMAQALLATKKIKIRKIRVHEATLCAFAKEFILSKELEDELFFIYKDAESKAEELFNALSEEKEKRGDFTYERLPKANQAPAEESIKNATQFLKEIETILKRKKYA